MSDSSDLLHRQAAVDGAAADKALADLTRSVERLTERLDRMEARLAILETPAPELAPPTEPPPLRGPVDEVPADAPPLQPLSYERRGEPPAERRRAGWLWAVGALAVVAGAAFLMRQPELLSVIENPVVEAETTATATAEEPAAPPAAAPAPTEPTTIAAPAPEPAPEPVEPASPVEGAALPPETIPGPPTGDEAPATRSEILEIQGLLAALKFYDGAADGIVGEQTTEAIRQFQYVANLPTDGRPTRGLLTYLREFAGQ